MLCSAGLLLCMVAYMAEAQTPISTPIRKPVSTVPAKQKPVAKPKPVVKPVKPVRNSPESQSPADGESMYETPVDSGRSKRTTSSVPDGYVDLGLRSGTLWKTTDEDGFYEFEEATDQYGRGVPNQQEWEELRSQCDWTWTGAGYNVVGPSGRTIYFSTGGFRGCSGKVVGAGERGDYWTSDAVEGGKAWFFDFGPGRAGLVVDKRCNGLSVRLVVRKK